MCALLGFWLRAPVLRACACRVHVIWMDSGRPPSVQMSWRRAGCAACPAAARAGRAATAAWHLGVATREVDGCCGGCGEGGGVEGGGVDGGAAGGVRRQQRESLLQYPTHEQDGGWTVGWGPVWARLGTCRWWRRPPSLVCYHPSRCGSQARRGEVSHGTRGLQGAARGATWERGPPTAAPSSNCHPPPCGPALGEECCATWERGP